MTRFWRTLGALLQALALGTALAIAVAKLMIATGKVAAFKYQGF